MIIDDDKINQITRIIKKTYNSLIVEVTGSPSLDADSEIDSDIPNENLLEAAYMVGHAQQGIPNNLPYQTPMPATVKEFLEKLEISRGKTLSAVQRYAINALRQATANELKFARDRTRSLFENLFRSINLEYRNKHLAELLTDQLESGFTLNIPMKMIVKRVRDLSEDLTRNWQLIITTAITDASNIGRMDAIVARNPGKKSNEIYVYKIVVEDPFLCPYCKQFYVDSDGSPKVYKLSTLQSNGTNFGKKKGDWQPVIGATHPFERCTLLELPQGFAFEPGSNTLKFKDENYVHKTE